MAFRIFSLLVALVMATCGLAQQTGIPVCRITSEGPPRVFETQYISADEFNTSEEGGELEGPCTEWLGQLCDDSIKCTIDFDYELVECLPEPRATMPSCSETT